MRKDNLIHLPVNVLFIKIEIILIFLNTFLVLFALFLLYNGKDTFEEKFRSVYLFINNNRIAPSHYLTNISIIETKTAWKEYGTVLCEKNSEYNTFFDIKRIKNASLTDVTKTIKVIDLQNYMKTNENQISNPDFLDAKFYELDFMKTGNETIEFMNTISHYTFKNYVFCKRTFYSDEDRSNLQIINKNKTCDSLAKDKTKNTFLDCGTLKDYYRVCVDKSSGYFNSRQLNNEWEKIVDFDYCPISELEIKFLENPEFKKNPKVRAFIPIYSFTKNNTVYSYKINDTTLLPYLDKVNDYDGDGLNQYLVAGRKNPKNLIINIENSISFNDYYDLENNTGLYNSTDFIYSNPNNINELKIGSKYGFRDGYTRIIDKEGFYSHYNSSNFLGATPYKEGNITKTSYLPFAMISVDSKSFYSPKVHTPEEEKKLEVNLGLYEMKAISINCFEMVFEKNERPDLFRFLEELRVDVLQEVYPTLIAWFFIVLFIQFWGFIKIRVSYLTDVLNFRANQADIQTEKITKYTLKFFLLLSFIIIYKGLSLSLDVTHKVIFNGESLIKSGCYPKDILENIEAVEEFSHLLDVPFDKVWMIFYFMIFSEVLNMGNYIINNKNEFKPVEKDKYLASKIIKEE